MLRDCVGEGGCLAECGNYGDGHWRGNVGRFRSVHRKCSSETFLHPVDFSFTFKPMQIMPRNEQPGSWKMLLHEHFPVIFNRLSPEKQNVCSVPRNIDNKIVPLTRSMSEKHFSLSKAGAKIKKYETKA